MSYTLQDFQGTATLTKATKTITFAGYTINSIKDIAVITDVTNGIIIYNFANASTGVFTYATQTLVLTYNTNTASFNNTDEIVVNLFAQVGEDSTTNTKVVTVANPTSSQYATPIELVNTTNVAAATNYYPDSTGMVIQGMKDISIQGNTAGGITTTFEITDEVAATPTRWLDCTPIGVVSGGAKAGQSALGFFFDEDFKIDFDNLNAYKIRVKSVSSDNTNTVYYTVIQKGF